MADLSDLGTPENSEPRNLGGGLTRRKVIKTTAWTVPAVAIVSAAPAYAAGSTLTWTVSNNGSTYSTGGSQAVFAYTVSVTGGVLQDLTVDIQGATTGNGVGSTVTSTATGWTAAQGAAGSGNQRFNWRFTYGITSLDATAADKTAAFNSTFPGIGANDQPVTLTFRASNSAIKWTATLTSNAFTAPSSSADALPHTPFTL